ncbi:hypothetical protein BDW75DRAFT_136683 [Aspergillus navahoensis]
MGWDGSVREVGCRGRGRVRRGVCQIEYVPICPFRPALWKNQESRAISVVGPDACGSSVPCPELDPDQEPFKPYLKGCTGCSQRVTCEGWTMSIKRRNGGFRSGGVNEVLSGLNAGESAKLHKGKAGEDGVGIRARCRGRDETSLGVGSSRETARLI